MLLCQESSCEGVCLCWSNGLPLHGCSSPSVPWGGVCAQGPAYNPAHGDCEKGCCFFRKPKAVATNARVMHTACKSPCQRSQVEGTMLYFYFKILFICTCARKRQKFAVVFNPAQLLFVKGGYNPRSTKPQAIQYVHKQSCGTELEMRRGSDTAAGVSRAPRWAQSQHCLRQLHGFHIQVA